MPTTETEQSSEASTGVILVCSGLALALFFGWVVENISDDERSDQTKSPHATSAPDTRSPLPAVQNSTRAIAPGKGRISNEAAPEDRLSSTNNKESKGQTAPTASEPENTIQKVQGADAQGDGNVAPVKAPDSRQPPTLIQPHTSTPLPSDLPPEDLEAADLARSTTVPGSAVTVNLPKAIVTVPNNAPSPKSKAIASQDTTESPTEDKLPVDDLDTLRKLSPEKLNAFHKNREQNAKF